jgi:hypothetical protein
VRFALAVVVAFWGFSAKAAYRDGFETPTPAWRLADSDCRARVVAQERTFQPLAVHSGVGAEYLRLRTEQGTLAHLTLSISPARVIEELRPSLWVKATRPRVQLRGRVILPRSRDPRDGAPLAVWVEGEVYDQPGHWQQLAIRDLPTQVQRQVWIKRGQPQSGEVDEREAYLDLIVLNAYTAPGDTDLWIDDLEVEGFTEALCGPPARRASESDDEPWREDQTPLGGYGLGSGALAQQQPPHLEGTTLVAGQGPLVVRMIEHRGESLAWLQSLGFNTVRLSRPATEPELEEARRLDLWLVAPPPHILLRGNGSSAITPLHDRIAAWDLGSDLERRELETAGRLAHAVRGDDPREMRPVLAGPREEFWSYRRFSDVLLLGEDALGTRRSFENYGAKMAEHASRGARSGPVWARVQTAPAGELLKQLEAIAGGPVAAPVEAAQIRLLTVAALEAGATGFCFRSPAPLDAGDAASQHRAAVLHALNEELALVEPWISGSSARETLDLQSDGVRGTAWGAERSKLILLARHYADDQFTAAPSPPHPVSVVLAGAPPSWKAYRITSDRLAPVWSSQVGGGMRINVPDVGRMAWIVVTDDPLTMNFLARRLRQNLVQRAKLRHEIVSREIALAEQVTKAAPRGLAAGEEAVRGLSETQAALRQCERLLDAGDFAGSLEMAQRTEELLARVRRQLWWGAASGFASRVSSPCCVAFAALPLHWNLTDRVRSSVWGPNVLAGGDFEDVQRMQAAGWIQDRDPSASAATRVELSPDRPRQGQYSLHLSAFFDARGVSEGDASQTPSIRISSPPTPLRVGDVGRVSGWVRGIASDDSPAMLRVRDSLGGETLADEMAISGEWRPFVLYRAAPHAAQLTISLELLTPGEVWIDSMSIEVLQSPGARGQFAQQPPR